MEYVKLFLEQGSDFGGPLVKGHPFGCKLIKALIKGLLLPFLDGLPFPIDPEEAELHELPVLLPLFEPVAQKQEFDWLALYELGYP